MKKIVAATMAFALATSASTAYAGMDNGEPISPDADPVGDLADLGCSIGLWWLCRE